jgi:DNA-dependent RNA polymerase auxiliary subunit epsilon
MGPTPGKKVFRVSIEERRTCDLYIEGDSAEEVREAVEADDLDAYNLDYDLDMSAHEVPLNKLSEKAVILHGVFDGEVHEIASQEYQDHLRAQETEQACVPDTLTLPLFPEGK